MTRRALVPALAVAAAVAVGVPADVLRGGAVAAGCPSGVRAVLLAASPELAPVVERTLSPGAAGLVSDPCLEVRVEARPAAEVNRALRGRPDTAPDVWIPDSSLWLAELDLPTGAVAGSVATSPVVFAAGRAAAERFGGPETAVDLAPALVPGRAPHLRLGLPEVTRSAETQLGLLTVTTDLASAHPETTAVAGALGAAEHDLPLDATARLDRVAAGAALTTPVREQAVWERGTGRAVAALDVLALYPPAPLLLDYPFVALATDPERRRDLESVHAALSSPSWTAEVLAAGFRGADGAAGPGLTPARGVNGQVAGTRSVNPDRLQEALHGYRELRRGLRMLAVVDTSGSMAAEVPGPQPATRMDLALAAATHGLALLGDDAHVGLWTFTREAAPLSDHRELAPIGPLGKRQDGTRGRELLARALQDVAVVENGGTGLYDTVLAAVRAVRQQRDPDRSSSVVLITDGRNEDDGLTLDGLLAQLQAEAGDRPVPVVAIAYGPQSDIAALSEISRVTGGRTYASPDPRNVGAVLRDALAQRLCRPGC